MQSSNQTGTVALEGGGGCRCVSHFTKPFTRLQAFPCPVTDLMLIPGPQKRRLHTTWHIPTIISKISNTCTHFEIKTTRTPYHFAPQIHLSSGQTKKIFVFPVTCFLKLGLVGRIIFLFFEIILFACRAELCHGLLLPHFHWVTV